MSAPAPMPMRWTGEAMEPLPRFAKQADQAFVIGEVYLLETIEERSAASHRQYFALIREAWLNLPFEPALQFPTPESLRKHCLIKAGYADVEHFVCEFKTEARRLAAALRSTGGEYQIITVDGKLVTRLRAKSQSHKAMPGGEFQASKDAVLGVLAEMIGVDPSTLQRQGKAA